MKMYILKSSLQQHCEERVTGVAGVDVVSLPRKPLKLSQKEIYYLRLRSWELWLREIG